MSVVWSEIKVVRASFSFVTTPTQKLSKASDNSCSSLFLISQSRHNRGKVEKRCLDIVIFYFCDTFLICIGQLET